MNIYTSYYGNRSLTPDEHFLVQVSNSAPAGVHVEYKFQEVIPDWNRIVEPYKKGELDAIAYQHLYNRQLDARRFQILLRLDEIREKAAGRDIVLLCYEKPGAFCHRRILAHWLEKNAPLLDQETLQVQELGTGQLSLF